MRLYAAILFCLLLTYPSIKAAPYNGTVFELSQPDGSVVPVHMFGDEFFQIAETPEGFTVIRDTVSGYICYAALSGDTSTLLPTKRHYISGESVSDTSLQKHIRPSRFNRLKKHLEKRFSVLGTDSLNDEPVTLAPSKSQTALPPGIRPLAGVNPVRGTYTGLTVLVDFSDRPATLPVDSIDALLNTPGYRGFKNNGSVRDYFYDVSGGKIEYRNIVMGYYRASNTKAYYESTSASFGVRSQELIIEALSWVDKQGFDFSELSANERMRALAVNIMYAGTPSQGWSEGLWPHQGNLSTLTLDNIKIRRYQITNIGSDLKIGVFCHENGHMLFNWPDLYDYGEESAGAGAYCIMSMTNEKNPVPPCAYLRDFSGWDAVTDLTGIAAGTTFTHVPNSNTSFVYRNTATTNEMFYIEGRRRAGRSLLLPDSGFLILHVDKNGSNDNEAGSASSHYLVAVEQADNKFELEKRINSGKAGDLFRQGYRENFSDTTSPNARFWNGNNSGLNITGMSAVLDTMNFTIGNATGTRYTVTSQGGSHGSIVPSGKISVAAGSSLSFVITPDSGYQATSLLVDGVATTPKDTIRLTAISSDKSIAVTFGLSSGISILSPQQGQTWYAGDTLPVIWQVRSAVVSSLTLSLSSDGGSTWSIVKEQIAPRDSSFLWMIPNVNSTSCLLRAADADGDPQGISGTFMITSRPKLVIDHTGTLSFTLEKGTAKTEYLSVVNTGNGDLRLSAASARQIKKVVINELSVGTGAATTDAIELYNGGSAIDVSGWEISWDDNKSSSGSYTFPEGYVLAGNGTFMLHDDQTLLNDNSAYTGLPLQWSYTDALQLSVTLTDPSGRAVDFVKSKGNADLPPEGTLWNGTGIDLCNSFVSRISAVDSDSATDWNCAATGTMLKPNKGQENIFPSTLSASMEKRIIPQGTTGRCIINIDAASLDIGTSADMLVLFHNDPSLLSPVRIPCMITVVAPASVRHVRERSYIDIKEPAVFTVAPNLIAPGLPVTFVYQLQGEEYSGNITIFSGSGSVLGSVELPLNKANPLTRRAIAATWKPSVSQQITYSHQTLLARLSVERQHGTRRVYTALFAFR